MSVYVCVCVQMVECVRVCMCVNGGVCEGVYVREVQTNI